MLTALAIGVDGLIYASWLFIVGVGLSLIFGVMKILNVEKAHRHSKISGNVRHFD